MSTASAWGTTSQERDMAFPCDAYLEAANEAYYRGVTIRAPAAVIFRWLCQMRVATYAYDSPFGRKSPRDLIPGLDELEIGQRILGFELAAFNRDRHLTIRAPSYMSLRDIAISYMVVAQGDGSCRLLVKWGARFPRGVFGWLMRLVVPWGDLVMMRRQLTNFKKLAERTAAESQ